MKITALAGGFGGARFLRGLRHHVDTQAGGLADHEIVVIANTGDDLTLHGLRICPDLDTLMYTLGGGLDEDQGWGRADETWSVREELAAYGAEAPWFGLGDRDVATHLVRTQMLDAGYPLSAVTAALCTRWNPGLTLLPMSDSRVETHVLVDIDGSTRAIHFQEWWLKHRAALDATGFVQVGAAEATPAPGVLSAITDADVILFPPSNPVVSIGAILSVTAIAEAIRNAKAPVIGISPVVAKAPLRGMADACLRAIGVECTAAAIAAHYGSRETGGLLDGWLVHPGDEQPIAGVAVRATPLLMSDLELTAEMARTALEFAEELRT